MINKIKWYMLGLFSIVLVAGGIAATINSATSANNGDVITAQAWNDLISQISSGGSGGGSGASCTSEGQLGCTLPNLTTNEISTWSCNYGWDGTNNTCNPAPESQISCLAHKNAGESTDGVYLIDPDGDGQNSYEVYCDMTRDGGGWTLVAGSVDGDFTLRTSGAVGTNPKKPLDSTITKSWKLSDADINLIGDIMKYSCEGTNLNKIFFQQENNNWSFTTVSSSTYRNKCSSDLTNWSGWLHHSNRYLFSDYSDVATTTETGTSISGGKGCNVSGYYFPVHTNVSKPYCVTEGNGVTNDGVDGDGDLWIR